MAIQKMPLEERPREKARLNGISSLSNYDLLALILCFGNKKDDILSIAHFLIDKNNGLYGLSKLSIHDFENFDGISKAKALTLKACFELVKRIELESIIKTSSYMDFENFTQKFILYFSQINYEEFIILFLNKNNELANFYRTKSEGKNILLSIESTVQKLIDIKTKAFIIIHNHPNGDFSPSFEDISFTTDLLYCLRNTKMKLLDNIIFTNNGYFSFKKENMLSLNK